MGKLGTMTECNNDVSGKHTQCNQGVRICLRVGARRGVLDLLDEAGHVLQEQVVHVLLVHVAELHDGAGRLLLLGGGHGLCTLGLGGISLLLSISLSSKIAVYIGFAKKCVAEKLRRVHAKELRELGFQ